MLVPQLQDGLRGNKDVNTMGNIPSYGFTNDGLTKPILRMNWTSTKPVENGTGLRQSVLLTNMGGVRGVMPCKGASSVGGLGGASYILRRPAISALGGIYPQQGFARSQQKGLAYIQGKVINQPLLPLADCFNAGLNSELGQPNWIKT
jgi:hypothetical protein